MISGQTYTRPPLTPLGIGSGLFTAASEFIQSTHQVSLHDLFRQQPHPGVLLALLLVRLLKQEAVLVLPPRDSYPSDPRICLKSHCAASLLISARLAWPWTKFHKTLPSLRGKNNSACDVPPSPAPPVQVQNGLRSGVYLLWLVHVEGVAEVNCPVS